MKPLSVLLLIAVALTHYGPELIALGYPNQEAAAKAWFYMLRGLEGAILFAVIASIKKTRAVLAVCALGFWEESLTVACRASKPIGDSPAWLPFSGLCGQEWYFSGAIALGIVALALAYELGRDRGTKGT